MNDRIEHMGDLSPEQAGIPIEDFSLASSTLVGIFQVREGITEHLPKGETPIGSAKRGQTIPNYAGRDLMRNLYMAGSYVPFKQALANVFGSEDVVRHVLKIANEDFDKGFSSVFREDLVRQVEDSRISDDLDRARKSTKTLLDKLCQDFSVPILQPGLVSAAGVETSK